MREAALPDNSQGRVHRQVQLLLQRPDIWVVPSRGLRREDRLPKGLDRPDGPAAVWGHHDNGHPRALAREAPRDHSRLQVLAREGEHEGERGRRGQPREDLAAAAGALDGGQARRLRAPALEGSEEDPHPQRGHPALRALGTDGEVQDFQRHGGEEDREAVLRPGPEGV